MRPRILAALLLGLCLPAAGGCSTNPATGQQSFTAFMSPEQEVKVGAEEHPKILAQFGGDYAHGNLQDYVDRVGQSLARVSEKPEITFTFTVLDDPLVNAFALPGGYIYITRGLLALAENEAEMAGVLAHEIGHVVARHSAQRYSRSVLANIGVVGFSILGAAADLPVDVGSLAASGAELHLKAFSRDQELESDMLAVRYLARAGYDPRAMTTFLEKMELHSRLQAAMAGREADGGYDFLSTHPRTVDRIEQAVRLANAPAGPAARVARGPYLASIDGMVFGDDPKQGVIKGRAFLHPDLGIAFEVPPDFTLFNGRTQVAARGPGGAAILFDMLSGDTLRQAGNAAAYVRKVRVGGQPLQNVEPITVNGMAAATGQIRVRGQSGVVDARLVAIQERPDRLYRFLFVTPANLTGQLSIGLQRTTYSFRRLTAREAAAIHPLRLRVVAVGRGETLQSLAAGMPFDRFNIDWFRTLNGLPAGETLPADGRVKIVTE